MSRSPLPWLLAAGLLVACDAPVYFPKEPDPATVDTALPTTGTGTTTTTFDDLPCSIESVTTVTVDIVNNSGQLVDVFWLDFGCQPVFMASLQDGQTLPQQSYATHSFFVQDPAGTRLAQITLDEQPNQTLVVTP